MECKSKQPGIMRAVQLHKKYRKRQEMNNKKIFSGIATYYR